MNTGNKIILIIIFVLVASAGALAQRGQQYRRAYNTNAVETIEGKVTAVNMIEGRTDGVSGVVLMVTTAKRTIPVHLGPGWYLEQQEQQLQQGNTIRVTGSRINYRGTSIIVAATVIRGEMILQLRDKNGYPRWRGWRRYPRVN